MIMKKLIVSLLLVIVTASLFVFSGCGSQDNTLYVYTNAGFAPYEYVDENNNIVGVDIDIVNYIAKELGYKIVIKDIDFGQILVEVGNNEMAIGAAGLTQTEARDADYLPSISYATSVQYVILPTTYEIDTVDGKVSVSQLAGLKIGVQESTTGSFLIKDVFPDDMYEYKTAVQASTDIGSKLGAVIIDKLPAQSICSTNSNLVCYELTEEPESYVIYFNKNASELKDKVNKVLAKMIEEGLIDQYTKNHSGVNA